MTDLREDFAASLPTVEELARTLPSDADFAKTLPSIEELASALNALEPAEVRDFAPKADLMGLREIAAAAGVSYNTARDWRYNDRGPYTFKVGWRVYARRAEVEAWVRAERRRKARERKLRERAGGKRRGVKAG